MSLHHVFNIPGVEHRASIAEWLGANLTDATATSYAQFSVLQHGRVSFLRGRDDRLAERFGEAWKVALEPVRIAAPALAFGGTRPRLTIYSRNDVAWMAARSWVNASKKADVAALKTAKAVNDPGVLGVAADEVASLLTRFQGRDVRSIAVTSVPCGHSRRSDCFGKTLAREVAARMSLTFREVFEDRFVSGVSHPKEFAKLPPLKIAERPPEPVILVVDDVATSGWHMEEALTRLRNEGFATWGAVWLAGNVE